jgi:hypothetical protein
MLQVNSVKLSITKSGFKFSESLVEKFFGARAGYPQYSAAAEQTP